MRPHIAAPPSSAPDRFRAVPGSPLGDVTSGDAPPASDARSVRRLRVALRILAGLFVAGALLYFAGPLWLPNRDFFQQLPFVSNSVVKVAILGLCALYAAGDLRRREGLVQIILAAHVVSVVAMLLVLVLAPAETLRAVDAGFGRVPVRTVLWGAIALDGVILALFGLLYLTARRAIRASGPALEAESTWLTPPEQWLRRLLYLLAIVLGVSAVVYEAGPIAGIVPKLFRELPFVTNSVVKVTTLALVCLYAARDLRRQLSLVGPVIAVHGISTLVQIAYLFLAPPAVLAQRFTLLGQQLTMTSILGSAIALDAAIGVLLAALYYPAWRARLGNRFFRPVEYRTLSALADVMVPSPARALEPGEIAANVDRALDRMRTERRGTFRIALFIIHYWPLLTLRPPLPELSTELRSEYIKRRFYREAGQSGWRHPFRTFLQAFTRVGHQLSALGYYSDRRSHGSIAYVPFSERPHYPVPEPPRPATGLQVLRPWDIDGATLSADVCIIGSGAGGAVLAYALAARGRDVLIVERGRYIEPRNFTEDELHQIGSLYDGGMLQISQDYRFTVLQGNCVGGSTTVNNAICFDPPPERLAAWNAADAGLDLTDLRASTQWVRNFLDVHPLTDAGPERVRHHRAAEIVRSALQQHGGALGLSLPAPFEANIRHGSDRCFGSGYCNIGCPWGKKLSMLDRTLPRAQRDHPGRVRILAECEVRRLRTRTGRPQHILDARARLADGRDLTIGGNTFIVSAGAIGSSHVLLRSSIGSGLPVGRHLAFNMMTPVFAEFNTPLNSYDGIQMGHYIRHAMDRFIVETWFSPPVGLATAMPGWFDEHYGNMSRAGQMVAYGMVVGTDNNGRATRGLTGDLAFRFTPTQVDMSRLSEGLDKLARVLLRAGARRVMLNTWDGGVFESEGSLERIKEIARDPKFITLASAHPQGGNAISRDPARGVVDDNFRVHGYDNLYVCDASVFPSSLQVNPQLTVMSLAHYAAARIV